MCTLPARTSLGLYASLMRLESQSMNRSSRQRMRLKRSPNTIRPAFQTSLRASRSRSWLRAVTSLIPPSRLYSTNLPRYVNVHFQTGHSVLHRPSEARQRRRLQKQQPRERTRLWLRRLFLLHARIVQACLSALPLLSGTIRRAHCARIQSSSEAKNTASNFIDGMRATTAPTYDYT